jgi:hypothetical protein
MRINNQTRDLIDEAVENGRVERVRAGRRGIVRKPKSSEPPKVRAESMGSGRLLARHLSLSEIEGDGE